jgi:hypothetical protein
MLASSHIEIRNIIKQIIFPATKQNLIQQAKKHGARSGVINDLESLPDREYSCLEDVIKEFVGR